MDRRAVCTPIKFDSLVNNPYAALLESLYTSLWNQEGFESFLSDLSCLANSSSAALMVISRDPAQMHWGWTVGISAKFRQWYQGVEDVHIRRVELLDENIEGFVAASLLLDNANLIDAVAETLKPWLREHAIVDTASLMIKYSENEYLLLVLMRNDREGKFNETDISQINFLVPFIKRTALLYVKIHRQQKMHDALIGAIRSLSQATVVLDEVLEVQHMNPAAEAVLENFSALAIINNKLVIDEPVLQQRLLSEVADLVGNIGNSDANNRVTLSVPHGKQSISLILTSVAGHIRGKKAKTVLLQISYSDRPLLKADYIREAFNISQTEAILCQLLVGGYSLKEIALKRDVSIHTVREQIRQIYQKTGYKRQAQLVAGILRAAA